MEFCPPHHGLKLWLEVPVELIQLLFQAWGRRDLPIDRDEERDVVPHGLLPPLGAVVSLCYQPLLELLCRSVPAPRRVAAVSVNCSDNDDSTSSSMRFAMTLQSSNLARNTSTLALRA